MALPRATAIKLAAQTVKSAAEMVLETEEHPNVSKDNVCSLRGLTIAAIESLEERLSVRGDAGGYRGHGQVD
ncbi:unnamed protein product [Ectocarpus fasciculatus]